MGPAVLQHLSQFADFANLQEKRGATEGYIAGQAVASAVSELFRSGFGVAYNDVDAFLFSHGFEQNTRRVLSTITSFDLAPENQYGHVVLAANAVYAVNSTEREGMLNEVLCRYCDYAPRDTDAMAQAFLRSFDLNCVQVAVRLHDQQLVWTPAFEQFLTNQELLVMNVKTPVHTAVRWFRKKAELEGVFGHDDKTMALLATSLARVRQRLAECHPESGILWQRSLRAQTCFGKVYAEKAAEVAGELGRYFDVVNVTDRQIALQTLVSRGGEIAELVTAPCSDLVLPTYARALQGHWRKHVCDQMVEALRTPSDSMAHKNVALEGPQAIAALSSPKDLAMLDKLCAEHGGISHQMGYMNTARQLAFVRELKDMAHREGLWVFGVFEHMEQVSKDLATVDTTQLRAYMEAKFAEAVLQYEEMSRTSEANMPRIKPTAMLGYRVSELVSFKDLLEEGSRMHHCVGGYFRTVVEGSSRILRLQRHRVEDCLTVQLYRGFGGGKGWSLNQVHGLQNRQASPEEYAVAQRLALLVNIQTALQCVKVSPSLPTLERVAQRMPALALMLDKAVTKRRKQHYGQTWLGRLKQQVKRWKSGVFYLPAATALKPAGAAAEFQDMDDIPF
jgi:hypothetical protein